MAVVERINDHTGRRLSTPSKQLRARLKDVGLEECLLVVDYLASREFWRRSEHFDAVSPFRPDKWDSRFDAARRWGEAGRPPDPESAAKETKGQRQQRQVDELLREAGILEEATDDEAGTEAGTRDYLRLVSGA